MRWFYRWHARCRTQHKQRKGVKDLCTNIPKHSNQAHLRERERKSLATETQQTSRLKAWPAVSKTDLWKTSCQRQSTRCQRKHNQSMSFAKEATPSTQWVAHRCVVEMESTSSPCLATCFTCVLESTRNHVARMMKMQWRRSDWSLLIRLLQTWPTYGNSGKFCC